MLGEPRSGICIFFVSFMRNSVKSVDDDSKICYDKYIKNKVSEEEITK